MKWICAQIGAREHYAIPRVINSLGKLDTLYTDFWATAGWRIIGNLTGKRSLVSRYHEDLANAHVVGFNIKALSAALVRKQSPNIYHEYVRYGEAFGKKIVDELEKNKLDTPSPSLFFGYDTGFLEPAQWVKAHGGKTIVCQMDPSRTEVRLVMEEEKKWLGWAKRLVEVPEAYYNRREKEWAIADLVMVNSEWSKQALMSQGVSDNKIIVVPLAYEVGRAERQTTPNKTVMFTGDSYPTFTRQKPLRVLFLGQVILRKGIQYLIQAAKLLKNEPIYFDVVGSIGISEEIIKSLPANINFHGAVTRDRTNEFYQKSDIFVLPTVSDGFALTQLEAMARGLPVVATPNCGKVVTHGVDGLIVPACDAQALADAFHLILQDPRKLGLMSEAAKSKVEQFSLKRLENNLQNLEILLQSK
jgi:glycosyltransferase involved in cell wall biosynthesis